jgi:diguanylate cyclase (GGDEF)-like protein/PAS domain S-box-containing protein
MDNHSGKSMNKTGQLPFQTLSKWISIFAMGVGFIALMGWILNISSLQSLLPGFPTMKGNTAVLFVLSSLSLWMQVKGQKPNIARATAMFVAFTGLLTMGEYLLDRSFGIDQLLFQDVSLGALHPGRMSPASALCFILIGFVLAFLDVRPKNKLVEYLITTVFAICGLALLGYLYGVSSLYKLGEYSSMAVPTALNFVILSIGIFFARPQRSMLQTIFADTPGGIILRRFLPFAIFVPVLLGWLSLQGQRAGFYDTYFGLALMVSSLILTLSVFIWLNAGQLTAMDEKRREIDDSLRESELRYRSTLESMIEGCQILGHDWRYLYLNAAAEKHNHRPNQELLGHVYMEMWPGIESTAVFESLERCMKERMASHMINEFTYPDGSKGWFELQIQPVPEGIFILSSDISNRKKAEQAILEREMKLSMLLDILPVGISILDGERNVSYTNPALKKILSISEDGLRKGTYRNRKYLRSDGTLMPSNEMASAQALMHNKASGVVETGVIKEDESIVWTQVSAVPVDFADWKAVIVTTDVTERKNAEERFRLAIESAPNAIIMVDQDGQIVLVNSQTEKYFGYERRDLLAKNVEELVPAHFRAAHANHRDNFYSQPQFRAMGVGRELYGLRKDGSEFPIEIGLAPINTREGILVLATIVDITERKQTQEDLLANERRLQLAASAGGVGIWDWNIIKDELIWDESMYSLYGLSKTDFKGAYDAWIRTLHPDDRTFTEGEIQAALRGEREYGPEFRVVRPDGVIRVMKATSHTIRDESGTPLRMIGTNIDITEQKQIEQEILSLNTELELKVAERTAELAEANEKLKELSLFDQLTGLYNRHGFLLLAEAQFSLAKRTRRNLLMFYADLDHLKRINDQNGHIAGDQAIVAAARALEETFRTTDIKARLGGDEFIVLAVEADDRNADTLLVRLHECLAGNGQSMSVGVVTWDAQLDATMDDLIARADQAMYREKRKKTGRDEV